MSMLPSGLGDAVSLADVLPSCLASLAGAPNRLDLAPAEHAIVVLVDGLGALALRARAGHARTLAPRLAKATTIDSGFPTTTAAALATLATGARPGEHGLVGYRVVDPATRTVFNELSGWTGAPDPVDWQRLPTVFERATDAGMSVYVVSQARYATSQLTRAILRGAEYVPADSIADRVRAAQALLGRRERSLVYLYIPELDQLAHDRGWESEAWAGALEQVDAALGALAASLGPRDGMLVTADHGVLDVPAHAHALFDLAPALVDGVELVAGDPRCLQLHLGEGATDADRDAVASVWRDAEGHRSWVATRAEAVAAGWFGPVAEHVLPRVGDVLVAARTRVAYYDTRTAKPQSLAMVGQHGSFSPEEVKVPLIPFGAFEP